MPILSDISVIANAKGNCIDLSWFHSDMDTYPNMRIVRRTDRHALHPSDGDDVYDGEDLQVFSDNSGLNTETIYYYSFFPYRNAPPEFFIDRRNRGSAMATGPYGFAELLFKSIPAIYHRYDSVLPDAELDLSDMSAEQLSQGQLRRFCELGGRQLDYIYSHIRASKHWTNPDRVHGNLLRLMGEWIGWKTDTMLEFDVQRKELKSAPHLYAALGMMPTMEATVKRISNWESRSKEFVNNIALSNNPERLNLWLREGEGGIWQDESTVFSIDHCYQGGISCVRVAENNYYLFYHTQRNRRWDIWYIEHLPETGWQPSQKLTHRSAIDKDASALFFGDILRVFWHAFDEILGTWHVAYRSLIDGQWSDIQTLPTANETKLPSAIHIDGNAWLFWSEKIDGQWRYRYAQWQVAPGDGSELAFPIIMDFPDDGTDSPRVEADVTVAYRADPSPHFYIFWARKIMNASNEWQLAYRRSTDTNLSLPSWSRVHTITLPAGQSICEPSVQIQDDGHPDLYASANRGDSGWAIWFSHMQNFDASPMAETDTWTAFTDTVTGHYSYRAPYYFNEDNHEWLFYRSNQHLVHESRIYGASNMNDWRYSGSTTVDTRNTQKMQLRGQFEDFQHYSFDTGTDGERDNDHWYGRDTVGIYFEASTSDTQEIQEKIQRLRPVLNEFMPITDRAVFIDDTHVQTEYVYHYSATNSNSPVYIHSMYEDALVSPVVEDALPPNEDFTDELL